MAFKINYICMHISMFSTPWLFLVTWLLYGFYFITPQNMTRKLKWIQSHQEQETLDSFYGYINFIELNGRHILLNIENSEMFVYLTMFFGPCLEKCAMDIKLKECILLHLPIRGPWTTQLLGECAPLWVGILLHQRSFIPRGLDV